MHPSASWQIWSINSTDSTGKWPIAVSPDNMTQSAPSSTALATSEAYNYIYESNFQYRFFGKFFHKVTKHEKFMKNEKI